MIGSFNNGDFDHQLPIAKLKRYTVIYMYMYIFNCFHVLDVFMMAFIIFFCSLVVYPFSNGQLTNIDGNDLKPGDDIIINRVFGTKDLQVGELELTKGAEKPLVKNGDCHMVRIMYRQLQHNRKTFCFSLFVFTNSCLK